MLLYIQIIFGPLAYSVVHFGMFWFMNKDYFDVAGFSMKLEDSDRYTSYTDVELYKIQLLRESVDDVLVKDYQRSDDFLIRWLREHDMDLASANKSLRQALKWREENQMDFILNKTLPTVKKIPHTCSIEGFDKRGGPVIIFKGTSLNVRDLLLNGLSDAIHQHFHMCSELYFQASIRPGSNGEQARLIPGIGIIDLQGGIEFYSQSSKQNKNYYPRFSQLVVIINMPSYGRKVIEMMWPFLSRYDKESLRVFGNDREEWTKFLLSVIPKNQLPERYGGTKRTATQNSDIRKLNLK